MQAAIENCLSTDRETRAAVERFAIDRTIDDLEAIYRGEPVAVDDRKRVSPST